MRAEPIYDGKGLDMNINENTIPISKGERILQPNEIWTAEIPTKPGYYWAKERDKRCKPGIIIIELDKNFFSMGDETIIEDMSIFSHFMGPLKMPERPLL